MKINEIIISDDDYFLEYLTNIVAKRTMQQYNELKFISNNFSKMPQDIFSIGEIKDYLAALTYNKQQAKINLGNDSQTLAIINELLTYFNTGF